MPIPSYTNWCYTECSINLTDIDGFVVAFLYHMLCGQGLSKSKRLARWKRGYAWMTLFHVVNACASWRWWVASQLAVNESWVPNLIASLLVRVGHQAQVQDSALKAFKQERHPSISLSHLRSFKARPVWEPLLAGICQACTHEERDKFGNILNLLELGCQSMLIIASWRWFRCPRKGWLHPVTHHW